MLVILTSVWSIQITFFFSFLLKNNFYLLVVLEYGLLVEVQTFYFMSLQQLCLRQFYWINVSSRPYNCAVHHFRGKNLICPLNKFPGWYFPIDESLQTFLSSHEDKTLGLSLVLFYPQFSFNLKKNSSLQPLIYLSLLEWYNTYSWLRKSFKLPFFASAWSVNFLLFTIITNTTKTLKKCITN